MYELERLSSCKQRADIRPRN